MWKLKVAEGKGPYLFSANNFLGRQTWEFDPEAGTPEEREEVEKVREEYKNNAKDQNGRALPCGDVLMRMQLKKENSHIDLSIPPVRLGKDEDVTYEAATIAVRKALRLNRAIQASDGHWAAENAGALFFTPPYLVALYISGTMDTILTPEHKKEMKRFIYLHQNEDGGWGLYIEGNSTMIGTVLSYVALRLLGESPDDGEYGVMTKGRKWILNNGGATKIPTWGKTPLAVLGAYEWAGCNPVPPEFWLWPSFLPFHPAKMMVYCRTTYMPMSYLYARKVRGPITDLVLSIRREIYTEPYEKINWNKARNECYKADLYYPHTFVQDLLWNSLHYISEPIMNWWPFNKIRERAIQKTLKCMRYSAEISAYITTGCNEKGMQMMCWWAENPNGDELKHHLARIADHLWLAEDGMTVQTYGSQSWDTAMATQAILATDMVEEYGDTLKKANFFLQESQIKENPAGDYEGMYRSFSKGAWAFSDRDHCMGVSDCTAEPLVCLLTLPQLPQEISGPKADTQNLYDAVNFLLYLQGPGGGFAIWEPAVPLPILEVLNPTESFGDVIVEYEHVECTASVLGGLVAFQKAYPQHRKKEIEIAIKRGAQFIENRQRPDGSWYGFWGICFIYETSFALRGLSYAGKTLNNSKVVTRGVEFLLSIQKEEGGWGESFESCPSMKYIPLEGNRTNVVQTAWAMLGLMQAGQVERDPTPIHKAAKSLINAQMDDGDFPQQEITGCFFKNCMLHYAQYKNIFPLWALAEYRKRVWTSSY